VNSTKKKETVVNGELKEQPKRGRKKK